MGEREALKFFNDKESLNVSFARVSFSTSYEVIIDWSTFLSNNNKPISPSFSSVKVWQLGGNLYIYSKNYLKKK